jgi:hypothetical protein
LFAAFTGRADRVFHRSSATAAFVERVEAHFAVEIKSGQSVQRLISATEYKDPLNQPFLG